MKEALVEMNVIDEYLEFEVSEDEKVNFMVEKIHNLNLEIRGNCLKHSKKLSQAINKISKLLKFFNLLQKNENV